jgi:hypothetical protein
MGDGGFKLRYIGIRTKLTLGMGKDNVRGKSWWFARTPAKEAGGEGRKSRNRAMRAKRYRRRGGDRGQMKVLKRGWRLGDGGGRYQAPWQSRLSSLGPLKRTGVTVNEHLFRRARRGSRRARL